MDRLEAMSILIAVVESGSLSAASRRLHMPLPTLSRKLSGLEAHLKTRLLTRSTRKLSLTEAGAAYIASARRILDEVGEAERAATGAFAAPKGGLTLAAPIVFGRLHILPAVTRFLAQYAEIDVRLVLSDRYADLIDEHIDLALRIGVLPDSSLVAVRVGTVRRMVCGSPAYFAQAGVPKTPQDLSRHAAITFDAPGAAQSWRFGKRDVPIRARLSVNTAEAALDAAIAGVGVTRVLSYQAADALRRGTLKTVLKGHEPEPLPVQLVHAGQGPMPRKLRSFLDFAVPFLSARLKA